MRPEAPSAEDLSARQATLQAEAAAVLAHLRLTEAGPVLLAGSYVSSLMCWREVDVMLHVGPGCSPPEVLRLLQPIVDRSGVVGFDYRDERGVRSPTGTARDERYHVTIAVDHGGRRWRVDLTLWLNDPHANITAWHEELRDTVTPEQRDAILRIKDVWHRRPEYPDSVSGVDIYAAVLADGVRSPEGFHDWLLRRDDVATDTDAGLVPPGSIA